MSFTQSNTGNYSVHETGIPSIKSGKMDCSTCRHEDVTQQCERTDNDNMTMEECWEETTAQTTAQKAASRNLESKL